MKERTIYIAEDGEVFETKEECEAYENKPDSYLIGDIPHKMVDYEDFFGEGSTTSYYLILNIQTVDQADRFMMWLDSKEGFTNGRTAPYFIGKVVFVAVYCGCECASIEDVEHAYNAYTAAEMIYNFSDKILHYVTNTMEKKETNE